MLTCSYAAVVLVSAGVSGHGLLHALHMLEHRLNAPEAAAGEHDLLLRGRRIRRLAERRRRERDRGLGRPRAAQSDREGADDQGDANRAAEGTGDRLGLEHGSAPVPYRCSRKPIRPRRERTAGETVATVQQDAPGRQFDIRGDRPDCYGRNASHKNAIACRRADARSSIWRRGAMQGMRLTPCRRGRWPAGCLPLADAAQGRARSKGGGTLGTTRSLAFRQRAPSTSWKRLVSEAEGLSRSAARLRRRAERRVLDSPSASEVLASMRSTARWVGGGKTNREICTVLLCCAPKVRQAI